MCSVLVTVLLRSGSGLASNYMHRLIFLSQIQCFPASSFGILEAISLCKVSHSVAGIANSKDLLATM